MNMRCCGCTFLVAVVAGVFGLCGTCATPAERKPFFDARSHTTRYAGPDDLTSTAAAVDEVRIGYFGPSNPADPIGGIAWRAASEAVSQANAQGGLSGKPFRLVPAWSANPWGTGVRDLTRLVYEQHVWAIVGGIDGPTTHLAEQVVAKARLPLVSPVSTDKTVNMANVPWMFSLAPDDARIAAVLAPEIIRRAGRHRLVVVASIDHDAHVAAVELHRALTRLDAPIELEIKFDAADFDPQRIAAACVRAKPLSVLLLTNSVHSADVLVALRRAGYGGPVFGGPAMGRREFCRRAGAASDGVIFPWLVGWPVATTAGRSGKDSDGPRRAPAALAPETAASDYTGLLTYDATELVIQAIRQAGLNRAEIGRRLRSVVPTTGQSGPIAWDGLGRNTRTPTLATIRNHRPQPLN